MSVTCDDTANKTSVGKLDSDPNRRSKFFARVKVQITGSGSGHVDFDARDETATTVTRCLSIPWNIDNYDLWFACPSTLGLTPPTLPAVGAGGILYLSSAFVSDPTHQIAVTPKWPTSLGTGAAVSSLKVHPTSIRVRGNTLVRGVIKSGDIELINNPSQAATDQHIILHGEFITLKLTNDGLRRFGIDPTDTTPLISSLTVWPTSIHVAGELVVGGDRTTGEVELLNTKVASEAQNLTITSGATSQVTLNLTQAGRLNFKIGSAFLTQPTPEV